VYKNGVILGVAVVGLHSMYSSHTADLVWVVTMDGDHRMEQQRSVRISGAVSQVPSSGPAVDGRNPMNITPQSIVTAEEMVRRAQGASPAGALLRQPFATHLPLGFATNAGVVFGESDQWPTIHRIKPESWASFFTDLTTGCVLVSVDGHMVSAQMGFSKFKGILKQQPSVKTDPEGFVMVWQRPLAEPEPEPVPELARFLAAMEATVEVQQPEPEPEVSDLEPGQGAAL